MKSILSYVPCRGRLRHGRFSNFGGVRQEDLAWQRGFSRLETSGRPGIWEGQTAENAHVLHFLVDLDSK
jgi:hypothetical protein